MLFVRQTSKHIGNKSTSEFLINNVETSGDVGPADCSLLWKCFGLLIKKGRNVRPSIAFLNGEHFEMLAFPEFHMRQVWERKVNHVQRKQI